MAAGGGPILVTGAAGFIGSHVVEALVGRGEVVVGLDNFDSFYPRGVKEENLAACRAAAGGGAGGGFEFVEGDIRDAGAVGGVMERWRPAGMIHLAARAGVRPSIDDPVGYQHVNVVGSAVVLEAARGAGCGRVVLASSSSVYGNSAAAAFSEEDEVSRPISPYAASKRACELVAHAHWHLTGMPTACLRFFTVYGPRQRPDLAVGMFLRKTARGEEIEMYGEGEASRDYTYVADIVTGVLAAYERAAAHGYRVWNLGGRSRVSLREMIRVVERTVGKGARVRAMPARAGDVERTSADLSRSARELGYEPGTGFEEGVARQWEWMRGRE